MGTNADRIIGGFVALASAGLGAVAVGVDPTPLWVSVSMAVLGVAGGLVKVGWFGGVK